MDCKASLTTICTRGNREGGREGGSKKGKAVTRKDYHKEKEGCRKFERDDGIRLKEIRVKNRVMMCLCRKNLCNLFFDRWISGVEG